MQLKGDDALQVRRKDRYGSLVDYRKKLCDFWKELPSDIKNESTLTTFNIS